jgi:hypothetical protein
VAVRRWAPITDLTTTPARRELTENLITARFLTTDRQGVIPVASFAHEALLRHWQRIAVWVARNREHLRLRARVEQSQERWEQHDRNESLLLPAGLLLEEGRQLLQEAPRLLNEGMSVYIRTSLALQERERLKELATRRRLRLLLVYAIVAALLAFALGGVAWWQASRARQMLNMADSNARLAERGTYNIQLLRATELLSRVPADAQLLLEDTHCCPEGLRDISWGLLYRFAARNPFLLGGHNDAILAVAFAPRGSLAASGSRDGTIGLWDWHMGQNAFMLEGHQGGVFCLAFLF